MVNNKNFYICRLSTKTMNVVIIFYANDQKRGKMSTTMLFVLDLNHCYHIEKRKNKNSPLSVMYAIDCTDIQRFIVKLTFFGRWVTTCMFLA